MKVLVLGPYAEVVCHALRVHGDEGVPAGDLSAEMWMRHDYVISFGYRRIIKPPIPPNAVNIHLSYLPWNRGADPNFWAWHDGTKHGVTIHKIAEEVDSGPIYGRVEALPKSFHAATTLRSSWLHLFNLACLMFLQTWPFLKSGSIKPIIPGPGGSIHKTADRPEWFKEDWDMPVSEIAKMGKKDGPDGHNR